MKSGYIKIDKEPDFTSKDVDSCLKRQLDHSKIGHLGTLDPFATGLLICLVGEATKLTTLIEDEEKEYVATLQLGAITDSLDPETEITSTCPVPSFEEATIKEVLHSFLGKQTQIPPLYSAKHYLGTKAYFLAREGSKVTLPPMDIEIKDIELLSFDNEKHELVFRVVVSKGTYIRVLGKDIAARLGVLGYLTALRRTKIGSLTLENSTKVKDATYANLGNMLDLVQKIKQHDCDEKLAFRIRNGQTIANRELQESEDTLLMMEKGKLIAIYKKDHTVYRCYKGINDED